MSRGATFTFAATLTALGMASACTEDRGGGDTLYGCPSVEACESPDATLNDSGGAQPLYGLADATFFEDSGSPDAADASFIDDSGDGGEDAD